MAGTRAGSVWYEKVEQIGEGTYGQVYRARHRVSGKVVALKKIRVHNEHNGLPLTAIREIKILKELSHPNMVELLEVVTLFLVLEYVDHDLAGLLDMHYCFSPQAIKMIIKQLLEVLQHMHEHRYVHRDIKCSNILLDNHHRLKLADFGLARRLCEDQDRQLSNKVITLWYRPPELLLGARRYGPPVDMWGVGCILSELILQKPLLPGKVELEQLEMIFKVVGTPTDSAWPGHAELPLWQEMQPPVFYPNVLKSHLLETARKMGTHSSMTPEAVDLIARLMTLDPQRRMSAKTALEGRLSSTPARRRAAAALRAPQYTFSTSHIRPQHMISTPRCTLHAGQARRRRRRRQRSILAARAPAHGIRPAVGAILCAFRTAPLHGQAGAAA
ncbi:kinase-like domain-containing protein [Tribonema minus]|uniref:Cyclin-dependent kinase 2 homolog n=1 Tax=Tribonema minus TaxID=303371 RepID=A0A835Z4S4_9STRA|nr:kinase-like domain-containing protein [Tribonema minus]